MITTIVGFAISMAFLFLMLSAACSAIQEIVANLLRWRATTLERGLAGLLLSDGFRDELYNLPLIKGLCSPNFMGRLERPAYIPSTTLALAILQVADDHGMRLDGSASANAQTNKFAQTEKLLASLLRGSTNATEQRQRIESWFNDSMDRVSGWYKRKSHAWIWVFGILLCLMLNADSISLSKRFWNDQALRDAVAAEATEYVKSTPKDQATGDDQAELDQSIRRMNLLREQLPGVPLGWCFVDTKVAHPPGQSAAVQTTVQAAGLDARCWPDLVHPTASPYRVALSNTDPRLVDLGDWSWWLWKLLGIVATVLAISQGAPFWFDMLQKAVNLRLGGNPPAPEPKKP
ncbi:MAG: hypothetical protein JSS95_10930 [Acidobacteria bacterium]|nr:hypothetical protein [Acidobacteriota bacterium]